MESVKRTRAHVARLDLNAAQVAVLDAQAHTARALWNLLHEYCTFRQGRLASVKDCDAAIRAARREIDWMGQLPAQAAQAVLKTYRQAWANFLNPDHPAQRPTFKGRLRSRLAVDVPQARDLQIKRVNRRWGAINLPKVGRVRFRWTKDLPGVTKGGPAGRITGARLVKEADGWHLVFRTETLVAPPRPCTLARRSGSTGGSPSPWPCRTAPCVSTAPGSPAGRRNTCAAWRRRPPASAATRTRRPAPSRRLSAHLRPDRPARATAKRRAVDWQHQTTTELAATFSVIKVENLSITNMVRSAKGTDREPRRERRAKGRTEPVDRRGGLGPDRHPAGVQERRTGAGRS